MGEIRMKQLLKKHKEALQLYTWMVKEDSTDVISLFYLGTIHLQLAANIVPKSRSKILSACEKLKRAIKFQPHFPEAFNNWGVGLSMLAGFDGRNSRTLFLQAIKKFLKAIKLRPSYHEALENLKELVKCYNSKNINKKKNQYKIAVQISINSEDFFTEDGAYDLACIFAIGRGMEKRCWYWLKVGEKAGTLPTRRKAMKDENLISVRDKSWFKAIRWKGE